MNGDATTPSWYYAKTGAVDGQQVGPVSWEQLVSLAQTGALTATDLVWNPQFPSWVTVAEVPGLLAPPLPRMRDTSQEMGPPPVAQPPPCGRAQCNPPRCDPVPSSRLRARPRVPLPAMILSLDDGEPADFGGQRSWLRWGMAIGAVVVIGIIVGVYFGVIKGGATAATTTSAPTTTVLETTTSDTEATWRCRPSGPTSPPPATCRLRAASTPWPTTRTNGPLVIFGGWDKSNVTLQRHLDLRLHPEHVDQRHSDRQAAGRSGAASDGLRPRQRQGDHVRRHLKGRGDPAQRHLGVRPDRQDLDRPEAGRHRAFGAQLFLHGLRRQLTRGSSCSEAGPRPPAPHLNDTWAYDPAANTWTDLKPTGDVPAARGSHAHGLRSVREQGRPLRRHRLEDKHLLQRHLGLRLRCQRLDQGHSRPASSASLRAGHRMAYDQVRAHGPLRWMGRHVVLQRHVDLQHRHDPPGPT